MPKRFFRLIFVFIIFVFTGFISTAKAITPAITPTSTPEKPDPTPIPPEHILVNTSSELNLAPNEWVVPYFPVGVNNEFVDEHNPLSRWHSYITMYNAADTNNKISYAILNPDGSVYYNSPLSYGPNGHPPKAALRYSSQVPPEIDISEVYWSKINCEKRGCHVFVQLKDIGANRYSTTAYPAFDTSKASSRVFLPLITNENGLGQDDRKKTKIFVYFKDINTNNLSKITYYNNLDGSTYTYNIPADKHQKDSIFVINTDDLPYPFEGSAIIESPSNQIQAMALISSNKRMTAYQGYNSGYFQYYNQLLPIAPSHIPPWNFQNTIAMQSFSPTTVVVKANLYDSKNQIIPQSTKTVSIPSLGSATIDYDTSTLSYPKKLEYLSARLKTFDLEGNEISSVLYTLNYVQSKVYFEEIAINNIVTEGQKSDMAVFMLPASAEPRSIFAYRQNESNISDSLSVKYYDGVGYNFYDKTENFSLNNDKNSKYIYAGLGSIAEVYANRVGDMLPALFSPYRVNEHDSRSIMAGDGLANTTPSYQCSTMGNYDNYCRLVDYNDLRLALKYYQLKDIDINGDQAGNMLDLAETLRAWKRAPWQL